MVNIKTNMKDYFEVKFWELAIYIIKKGYGEERCGTPDWKDFHEMYKTPGDVFHPGRCACCRAWEMIDFIEGHIKLIKM
jgi:hypothetical protein